VLTLVLGSVLAVLSLAYVLMPLLRGGVQTVRGAAVPEASSGATAVDALREIEFDRETGKLSDDDYAALKSTYTPLALQELRERAAHDGAAEPKGGTAADAAAYDPAEALIAQVKGQGLSCSSCGPRPESDALFCSDCGRFLGSSCPNCGAAPESERSRFCVECGAALAPASAAAR